MKMSGGPATLNIKIALLIVAVLIAVGTLYYTQNLVRKLQEKERQIVQLYANGIQHVANSITSDSDITFLFDNILMPIDFPLISTGPDDTVIIKGAYDFNNIRNVKYDSTLGMKDLELYFTGIVREMDDSHDPILVKYQDSVIQKIHYGDSELIKKLRFYPYLQIIIASLFIIIGYVGFSNIKKSEQGNIWVGMAKETAHQFGTPISSLMGWLEMLKLHYNDPDKVLEVTEEINNDVDRLNRITYRFSKIGSTPEMKKITVYNEVTKIVDYFRKRLPQTGKMVDLTISGDSNVCAKLNSELFGWVIENLIKNALDAINHKDGKISISVKECRRTVEVDVIDNGKGIDLKRRKDVFRPGYSTKRRGWGLGLSLSKRIIEGYHGGRISVKSSAPGEGTTFKIVLNKC